jgi:hypothetical protein
MPLNFTHTPDYEFQNPKQVEHAENGWLKAVNKTEFVIVKAGNLPANIVFSNPGKKTLFWDKPVEWTVELPARNAKVHYVLEGEKLKREFTVGPKTSDKRDGKVDPREGAQSSSIHIRAENGHVTITNDQRKVLDDFTAAGYDFSGAQIGIKTDSFFLVHPKE